MAEIPDTQLALKAFNELMVNPETGLLARGKRHHWGVFDDPKAPANKKDGFVASVAFVTVGKPELSLVIRPIESGEPTGSNWSFDFSPKGKLTSVAKIIDNQGASQEEGSFQMRGEIYYPSANERWENEALESVAKFLEELTDPDKRVRLNSQSQERGWAL